MSRFDCWFFEKVTFTVLVQGPEMKRGVGNEARRHTTSEPEMMCYVGDWRLEIGNTILFFYLIFTFFSRCDIG